MFTRFQATVFWLDTLLAREGIGHASFTAGLDGAAKQAALERAFRADARC